MNEEWRKASSIWSRMSHSYEEVYLGSSSQDLAFCALGDLSDQSNQDNSFSLAHEFRRTREVWLGCLVGGMFSLWLLPVGGISPKPLPPAEEHLSMAEAQCPRWTCKREAFQEHHQLPFTFCWPHKGSALATPKFYFSHPLSHPENTLHTELVSP